VIGMLSKEQNALITRTGPGTPGGALLRRYWQPVALAEELPPGGAPLPVRILSEDLVLFRDEQGQPGLLGLHCPHRGADLSYGRLEDGGLRCLYHGWLFDVTGQCREQPGEPQGSTFHERVRHTAYPCQEAGDLILAYLGPGEPPLLPDYEFLAVPTAQRCTTKVLQECNYLQANEGNIDPQHLSFLHRQFDQSTWEANRLGRGATGPQSSMTFFGRDVAPTIEVEETEFGVRIYSVRKIDDEQNYVRISSFIMPNLAVFPGSTGVDGFSVHWHVPVDDVTHWKYLVNFRRSAPMDKDAFKRQMAPAIGPGYRMPRNQANRYLQDREEMTTRTFSGMGAAFHVHDAFATETQGPIQDRAQEHLGTTDRAIILARQMLLRGVRDVEEGRDPPHVQRVAGRPEIIVRTEAVSSARDWHTYWREPVAAAVAVS
jgi:phenylpropionate dioxygenase-like ring-hydroxylating dioxygenase large terminal subunit